MIVPNFICIGTQRAGTSWLYDCLSNHPEVFLPDCKDITYFRAWQGKPSLHEAHGIEPYLRLFQASAARPVRLDISAGLLAGPGVAARMHQVVPDCKLIAILRNPVERAISHYDLLSGRSNLPYSLQELAEKPETPDPHEILREGLYAEHLEAFFQHYPRERFLFLFYEDLVTDPQGFLRQVCEFLGVQSAFAPPQLHVRVNGACSYLIKALYDWNTRLGTFLLVHQMNGLRRAVKYTGLPALIRRLNTGRHEKVVAAARTRSALLDHYRKDIGRLEEVLGRDLKKWLQEESPSLCVRQAESLSSSLTVSDRGFPVPAGRPPIPS